MRFFMYTLGDENVPMPPPTPELFACLLNTSPSPRDRG
jgi:hypothetical protein